jgi:hypothetical protein
MKSKLILTAVVVIAAVSGSLAFTKVYSTTFCTRPHASGTGACTGTVIGLKSTGTPNYYGYQKVTDCTANCTTAIDIEGE